MRPSLRYRLDRLARTLVREPDPFDGDPPTWDWPAGKSVDSDRTKA